MKNLLLVLASLVLNSTQVLACLTPCGSSDCIQYGVFDVKDNCQYGAGYIDASNWTENNIRYLASDYLAPLRTGDVAPVSKFGVGSAYDEYSSINESENPEKLQDNRFADAQGLFKSEMFVEAAKEFAKLKKEKDLRAEASYLEGRSYLGAAQKAFSGYLPPGDVANIGNLSSYEHPSEITDVDFALLKKSREAFEKYLKEFPDHEWAPSARNLVGRRINLLEGKAQAYTSFIREELDRELTHISEDPFSQVRNAYLLLEEFDRYGHYFSKKDLHPLLWIIRANYVSRKYPTEGLWSKHPAEKELPLLRAQKEVFKKFPELFGLAEAQLLHATGKHKEGLASFPLELLTKDKRMTLSWAMLRANLLLGSGQSDEARKYIREFVSGNRVGSNDDLNEAKASVKQWITFSYFWANEPVKMWLPENAANWPFIDEHVVGALVGQSPDLEPVVKQLATKGFPKDIPPALQKSLSTGLLVKFSLELDSSNFLTVWPNAKLEDWQPIANSFTRLQKNTLDMEARFKIISGVERMNHQIYEGRTCEKGRVAKSKVQSPLDHYVEIMDELKKTPNSNLLPEVLAASIHCYKISARYSCLESAKNEIPPAERKKWFQTLKTKYPNSEAAQNTKFWW